MQTAALRPLARMLCAWRDTLPSRRCKFSRRFTLLSGVNDSSSSVGSGFDAVGGEFGFACESSKSQLGFMARAGGGEGRTSSGVPRRRDSEVSMMSNVSMYESLFSMEQRDAEGIGKGGKGERGNI